jgi:opacity protein-like surface antigen
MRKLKVIIFIITFAAIMRVDAFARFGPSFGMTLGYQNDMGSMEGESINHGSAKNADSNGGVIGLPLGIFCQYTFIKPVFVRTGFDYGFNIFNGASDDGNGIKRDYSASYWDIPLMVGIVGSMYSVNIYVAGGAMWLSAETEFIEKGTGSSGAYKTTITTSKSGFGAIWLIGAEVALQREISIMLEYVIYFWAKKGDATSKTTDDTGASKVKGTAPMDFNNQIIRLGVRYSL